MEKNFSRSLEKGKDLLRRQRYEKASLCFEELIRKQPASVEAHFEFGKTSLLLGERETALKEFRRAVQLDAGHFSARLFLAKIYRESGDPEKAFEEILIIRSNSAAGAEIDEEFRHLLPRLAERVVRSNFEGNYNEAARLSERLLDWIPDGEVFFRNKILNEWEIASRKTELRSWMRSLMVTLTTDCNLSCIMCEQRGESWQLPRRTAEEIEGLFPYLERVMWQGGESFLSEHFDGLVKKAASFTHLQQVITTNGLLLDEDRLDKLIGPKIDFTFSIDGVTKDTYEKIRRGGDFERLLKNLKLFNKLRKEKASGQRAHMNVVVTGTNYGHLEDFVNFAIEYGFSLVAFLPLGGCLARPENIFLEPNQALLNRIRKALERVDEKAKKGGITIENQLPVRPASLSGKQGKRKEKASHNDFSPRLCHLPWLQLFIDYQGGIRPDCDCLPGFKAGNVEGDRLRDVWNNALMKNYRKAVAENSSGEICNRDCIEGRISGRYLRFG